MTSVTAHSTRMFAEAAEAPAVVARQLLANEAIVAELAGSLRVRPPRAVITCARGSSDHAATYFKHLIETRAGVLVASASPSTASVYAASPAARDMLAVGLSQSGKSPDLLATMNAAAVAGARTLAMVNVANSPLAHLSEVVLPLRAGAETSVAATKSYIALLAQAVTFVASWADDTELADAARHLPELLTEAWEQEWSPLVEALANVRGLYVIGRGPSFGIAQEAALKFKETCGLHAEAFSAAEVRHGPMALVGPDLPLLIFRQDDEAADGLDALARDAVAKGARVLVAGTTAPMGAVHLPVPAADPTIAPILAVQAFYRAGNALSVLRGFDPDRPPHLSKVTETV